MLLWLCASSRLPLWSSHYWRIPYQQKTAVVGVYGAVVGAGWDWVPRGWNLQRSEAGRITLVIGHTNSCPLPHRPRYQAYSLTHANPTPLRRHSSPRSTHLHFASCAAVADRPLHAP